MPISEPAPTRRSYTVTSDRCVWGKPGDEVELVLTDNQEQSLLEAGTVKKRAVPGPSAPVNKRK